MPQRRTRIPWDCRSGVRPCLQKRSLATNDGRGWPKGRLTSVLVATLIVRVIA